VPVAAESSTWSAQTSVSVETVLDTGTGLGTDRGSDRVGALSSDITPHVVTEVLEISGRREQRRRDLPALAVVYFVLALCLFSGADSSVPPGYRSVWRSLTTHLRSHRSRYRLPSSSALSKARQRLGSKPFHLLFERQRGPLADPSCPGAFAFDRRLVAWDGTTLDVALTKENEARFGCPSRGGNPQIRLMALIECGTHAVIDAAFDGIAHASEQALARRLLATLQPGMLLLADRNFPGHELWGLATATGADLIWRAKSNQIFLPTTELSDGSFLSIVPTPRDGQRQVKALAAGRPVPHPLDGHEVRIVEYTITVHTAEGERIEHVRLITTLLDPDHAPADLIAALYHQRWESENGYDEVKTCLRGAGFILRSTLPDLVEQELFAFLTIYQALCRLETDAAHTAGIDPDRISFTVTLRVTRDQIGTPTPPTNARLNTIADLLDDLLPPRRNRTCERIKKPPKNTYPTKKQDHTRPPSRATYTITVTRHRQRPAPTP
jgi:Insertion element 4 transposase N-terminal/Transposase DDE domain